LLRAGEGSEKVLEDQWVDSESIPAFLAGVFKESGHAKYPCSTTFSRRRFPGRAGYNTKGRLKVEVSKSDVIGMVLYPAPTYVIGIDEKQETAYIVAVHAGMDKKISSLNTAHRLDCTTLKQLWDEVKDYWKDKDMTQKTSRFTN
jgi:hypothetical protein